MIGPRRRCLAKIRRDRNGADSRATPPQRSPWNDLNHSVFGFGISVMVVQVCRRARRYSRKGCEETSEVLVKDGNPGRSAGATSMSRTQSLPPIRRVDSRHDREDARVATPAFANHVTIESQPLRTARTARSPSARATARIREQRSLYFRVKPRRRLRREFRLLAYALKLAAPLMLGVAHFRGVYSERSVEKSSSATINVVRPPAVSLMFEGTTTEPVVLPGYVLPYDGIEESSHHAGG